MIPRGAPFPVGDTLAAMILRTMAAVLHGLVVMLLLSSAAAAAAQGSADETIQQYSKAGQQALAARHYDEAEADFKKLLQLDPDIAEIHATLGLVYFQEKKFDEAVPELRRALRQKPELARASTLLAMSLSELGQYQEALPGLENGFHKPPDPLTKRMCGLQLMRAYTGLQRDSEAVNVALELNRVYPDDPEILYHTGRVYGNFAFLTPRSASIARYLNSIHDARISITASAGLCWHAGNLAIYPKTGRKRRRSLSKSCSWIRAMPTPSTSWPRSIAN
jgi:tetratricopeptide (TPR) repeat protein